MRPRGVDIEDAYRRYGHSVLRRARMLLGHEEDAMEVLQEVFLELTRRSESFEGGSALSTYLYSMTTHRCLNRLRNERNRARLLREQVAPHQSEGREAGTDAHVSARELLAHLPDDVARAAVHYYLDEMSQAEIAEIMGCSRRHVGNLLERARERAGAMEGAHAARAE